MLAIICNEPSSEQRACIDSVLEDHLIEYERELMCPTGWVEQQLREQEEAAFYNRPYLHEMDEPMEIVPENEKIHIGEIELWQRIDYFMEYYEGVKGWTL